jgi:uncharacterized protein
MKFAQDTLNEGYVITAYDDTSISINGKSFSDSLIITADQLEENWDIQAIHTLQQSHVDKLLAFEPELIIIGTGSSLIFPAAEIYAAIINRGIGIEFMDTAAACRTYNILVSEGRNVVAGLIQSS